MGEREEIRRTRANEVQVIIVVCQGGVGEDKEDGRKRRVGIFNEQKREARGGVAPGVVCRGLAVRGSGLGALS